MSESVWVLLENKWPENVISVFNTFDSGKDYFDYTVSVLLGLNNTTEETTITGPEEDIDGNWLFSINNGFSRYKKSISLKKYELR